MRKVGKARCENFIYKLYVGVIMTSLFLEWLLSAMFLSRGLWRGDMPWPAGLHVALLQSSPLGPDREYHQPLGVTRWVCWLTFSPCTCARCSRNVQRQGTSVLGFPSLRWNGDEDKQRGVEGAQRCLVFLLATGEALLASRLVLSHLQGHPTGIYKVIVLDAGGEAWELHSKNISCLHRVHMIRKEH